jgi:hypothetical protein
MFAYRWFCNRISVYPSFRIHHKDHPAGAFTDTNLFPAVANRMRNETGPFLLEWDLYDWRQGTYVEVFRQFKTGHELRLPTMVELHDMSFDVDVNSSRYDLDRAYAWIVDEKENLLITKIAAKDPHLQHVFTAARSGIDVTTLFSYGLCPSQNQAKSKHQEAKDTDSKEEVQVESKTTQNGHEEQEEDEDEKEANHKRIHQCLGSKASGACGYLGVKAAGVSGIIILPYSRQLKPIVLF